MLTLFLVATLAASTTQPDPPVNRTCPVDGEPVDARKDPTVVVKTPRFHKTYYVCCKGCGRTLTGSPAKFLLEDGTPRVDRAQVH